MNREFERVTLDAGAAQLTWMLCPAEPKMVNFEDALSATIVGAMCGSPVKHTNWDDPSARTAAVGAIPVCGRG